MVNTTCHGGMVVLFCGGGGLYSIPWCIPWLYIYIQLKETPRLTNSIYKIVN